jgi:hypothetical protein
MEDKIVFISVEMILGRPLREKRMVSLTILGEVVMLIVGTNHRCRHMVGRAVIDGNPLRKS